MKSHENLRYKWQESNSFKTDIMLRKFPFPYRCALSICSDLDGTDSIESYLTLQHYLCTSVETPLGEGLNLEVGNSFWFFRNASEPGLSYFLNTSKQETKFAPICRKLVQSGYIDVLHTYGDYNNGGFRREYAELAAEEMDKQNLKIFTWVNHGNTKNAQNLGNLPWFAGDVPDNPAYHLDIARKSGIRYFWLSQLTHLVGQSAKLTAKNLLKNPLQKAIAVKNRGLQIDPFFSNRLMEEVALRDQSTVKAFLRFINPWGRHSRTDVNNIPYQLSANVLEELMHNQGYLVLYTHLGNNLQGREILPEGPKKALKRLAELNESGKIFVTTTTRLLKYYELWHHLQYTVEAKNDFTEILLHLPNPSPHIEDLQGITFYCRNPQKTILSYRRQTIPTTPNPTDHTGRRSISIPWKKFAFPAL